ncbi:AraC family transcriptional regulator [Sphingomonas sp. LB-2]|uniref:helix-turn-helix domain-containing protein n=1 Tax=Sphingomonas caeni TaxID=2984949 RepID=UPI002230F5A0|nr:AraC family transcriptional regulator [Sphingomonas caeni]MCW3846947.1 AraC family transcriptional regulator [Sphingomonas caeni]
MASHAQPLGASQCAPIRRFSPGPGKVLRWPGGEAVLCRADAFAALPAFPSGSFTILFSARDRGRWELAAPERRVIDAGARPLTAAGFAASAQLLAVALSPAFLLDAAGLAWHPNLAFRSARDGGDDIAWLMGVALRQECRDGGRHGPDYAARIAGVLAARLAERHVRLDTVRPLQGGLTGHRLRACLDHIERNLHRDLALAELAELANLSTPHFARAFRRSLGEPPYRYFRRQRIERAKRLLAETDQGIAEVALECGYAAQSHFSSAFKLLTMKTPAAYRRAERELRGSQAVLEMLDSAAAAGSERCRTP